LQLIGGALFDDGDVLRRHPEHLEHDELRHDLVAPVVESLVDEAAHEIADERLEGHDPAPSERGVGDAAGAGARRGLDVGQGRA
jgi:hypothetical protein